MPFTGTAIYSISNQNGPRRCETCGCFPDGSHTRSQEVYPRRRHFLCPLTCDYRVFPLHQHLCMGRSDGMVTCSPLPHGHIGTHMASTLYTQSHKQNTHGHKTDTAHSGHVHLNPCKHRVVTHKDTVPPNHMHNTHAYTHLLRVIFT
jgi:hypothetical protein